MYILDNMTKIYTNRSTTLKTKRKKRNKLTMPSEWLFNYINSNVHGICNFTTMHFFIGLLVLGEVLK